MNTTNVSSNTFDQEVVKSTIPVVVDFWAEWCGPCKSLSPFLDQLATDYAGKAKICKVNVDENQDLAAQFNVHSIPTLLFFKNGQVMDQVVGLRSMRELKAKLDSLGG